MQPDPSRTAPACLLAAAALLLATCAIRSEQPDIDGETVTLTLLHTSDIHSRLIPYDLDVGEVDAGLGLDPANAPFGGAARLAFLVHRERASSSRVLHVDTGDPFQGAPIFNVYEGEAEFRVLSEIGVDAMVVGNHEFDRGPDNLADKLDRWAAFTPIVANYLFRDPGFPGANDLGRLIRPFAVFDLEGLRVGVIGLGDVATMHSILETGNDAGITPLDPVTVAQSYIDLLRPSVDVVVLASHLGLTSDQEVIEGTTGADVVLGGHLHIVLQPPKVVMDCQSQEVRDRTGCAPRPVVLAHSGAFNKYLGRLDLALEQSPTDPGDWEVISHSYRLFPVDATVPEDPVVKDMIRVYEEGMDRVVNVDQLIGYAPLTVRRFGSGGGDSALGNLVSTSMWLRRSIETDFALTNTTGIRSDLPAGPVTVEDLYNVFPFDNTITTMFLTGEEVQELFDYVAHRTTVRGCQSQAQIAGAKVTLVCGVCGSGEQGCASEIRIGSPPEGGSWSDVPAITSEGVYELATNNYIAQGGSGYFMLRRNTTQMDSGVPQRDAAIDYIRTGPPCMEPISCAADSDCGAQGSCVCNGLWSWPGSGECLALPEGCVERHCVLASGVEDIAAFYGDIDIASGPVDPAESYCTWRNWAADECSSLACVDGSMGAEEDGRIAVTL